MVEPQLQYFLKAEWNKQKEPNESLKNFVDLFFLLLFSVSYAIRQPMFSSNKPHQLTSLSLHWGFQSFEGHSECRAVRKTNLFQAAFTSFFYWLCPGHRSSHKIYSSRDEWLETAKVPSCSSCLQWDRDALQRPGDGTEPPETEPAVMCVILASRCPEPSASTSHTVPQPHPGARSFVPNSCLGGRSTASLSTFLFTASHSCFSNNLSLTSLTFLFIWNSKKSEAIVAPFNRFLRWKQLNPSGWIACTS